MLMATEKTNAVAEVIGAIASLTWPLTIAAVIWYFRMEIRPLLHFQIGKRVAWEWSPDRVWGKTCYRVLETGEKKEAWVSSLEFIGRHSG
jgi:hypothetical protein